ncbi:rhomboid family intramembrane serine protease [Cytobacillus sp. FJAT-54145]|uniref:Rhomboid family intramembrane serine protease n=1 Tax=Cytobacillus spartinae TaxID=3299023 RepID=A0ABW6KI02_9BACI
MKYQEDYIFWRLAYFLINNQEYRIIQLSKDQNELWLEKTENKKYPLIRLLRYDLDWSNWMQRDIERTAINGENIRKQVSRREMNVLNVYVSAFVPVDDYEYIIQKPFDHPRLKKIKVDSLLVSRQSYRDVIHRIENLFDDSINLNEKDEFHEEEIEQLKQVTLTKAVNRIKTEKALFEFGKPFFTYFFIAIQVIVFLLLELNGGSTNTSTLIQFGAKFNPLIIEGEWWRFLSPIVLHIGIFHLLMNTLALYFLGTAVEKIYGNSRFLFIYLIAGFCGSVASFIFSPNLSAGASGAIFGCFGALLYFGLIYPKLFFRTMGANILVVLAINLSFGFTIPGIDNAGHIGGLIGGFLATGIVHFPKKKKVLLQSLFFLLTIGITSGLLVFGYNNPSAIVDEQSIFVMAQEHIQSEEYEKAYSLLIEYMDSNEQSAELYFLLSYVEIKQDKIDDAKENLLKVIEIKPSFHEAHYNLALVYLEQQDLEEAKKYANQAVELKPKQSDYVELLKRLDR